MIDLANGADGYLHQDQRRSGPAIWYVEHEGLTLTRIRVRVYQLPIAF